MTLVAAVALSASLLGAAPADSVRQRVTAEQPPNVVLFMLDDATAEDVEHMPNVQQLLADQGTTFTNHYAPYPLCCPARATLLTGQYPHNHQVLDNVAPLGGAMVFDDSNTIATYLTDDYRTAFIGKYMNDFDDLTYVPPGWDTWKVPVDGTYDFMRQTMSLNGTLREFEGYTTTTYGQQARVFIDKSAAPYFAVVSFVAPHRGTPHDDYPDDPDSPYVDVPYRGTYDGPSLPVDTSFNETDLSDKHASLSDRPLLTDDEIAYISERLAQRRESLRSVDDEVASIVEQVAAEGELDNTYFVLLSDNGQMQGQHRVVQGKSLPYEPSTRVPLIIRGPGFPAGRDFSDVTGLQDVTPTVLSMTRQWQDQPEAQIDGISLVNLLRGTAVNNRAEVIEAAEASGLTDVQIENGKEPGAAQAQQLSTVEWKWRGIVTGDRWKYVHFPRSGEFEMYNLNVDPFEEHNIYGDPAHARKQDRLAALYAAYRSCDGNECK